MKGSDVSPWSFADLLCDDVAAWISRCCEEVAARGEQLPTRLFREQLCRRLGITPKRLEGWCSGKEAPTGEQLEELCKWIGSNRAVKHLARRCGVGVYDLVEADGQTGIHVVREVADVVQQLLIDAVGSIGSHESVAHELAKAACAIANLQVACDRALEEVSKG